MENICPVISHVKYLYNASSQQITQITQSLLMHCGFKQWQKAMTILNPVIDLLALNVYTSRVTLDFF